MSQSSKDPHDFLEKGDPDAEHSRFGSNGPESHSSGDNRPGDVSSQEKPEQESSNIVDWESDDDPANPLNWPPRWKIVNVVLVSTWTFLTPLASSMVAPGVGDILLEFHSSSRTIGSFIVSIYVLGYATGPLFLAPLSEVYGRMPVYHLSNSLFVVWTLACAFAPNIGGLLVFRFFEGMAGVCALTIGSGTISDLIPPEKRGSFMSIYSMGPLLGPARRSIFPTGSVLLYGRMIQNNTSLRTRFAGPVIGPIAGAFLSEKEGWRWVFRVLSIASGVMAILTVFTMRETRHAILLKRKTERLRKETGNQELRSKLDSGLTPAQEFKRAIIRPTKLLLLSPICALLSLYMAVVYGYLYLIFTTITGVYEDDYHWNGGVAGLSYLGIGIGMFLGLFAFALTSDRTVAKLMKKNNTDRKPEYRLPLMMVGALFVPIGLFWYGFSAQYHVQYIMPIIGTGWVGAGLILTFLPISTYLVDAFTYYAASAMAANTVLRSLVGCFLPLAGPAMYSALGLGWGNALLGFIALALWPVSWIFYRYGERIRTSKRFQVQL